MSSPAIKILVVAIVLMFGGATLKAPSTLFRGAYEVEEGWVFVYGTHTPSGETHVLFPAEDPEKYRVVEAPAKG